MKKRIIVVLSILFSFILILSLVVFRLNFQYYFYYSIINDEKALWDFAQKCSNKGKEDLAIKIYKQIIEIEVTELKKSKDKGHFVDNKALVYSDFYLPSLYNLGVIYYNQGKNILKTGNIKKALRKLALTRGKWQRILTINPNYKNKDKILEGMVYIDSADDITHEYKALIHKCNGNLFYYKKQYDDALEEYSAAVAIDSDYSTVYNNIGSIYFYKAMDVKNKNKKKYLSYLTKAISNWEIAIQKDPEHYNRLHLNIGMIFYQHFHNNEMAVIYLKKYIDIFPKDKQVNNLKKLILRLEKK